MEEEISGTSQNLLGSETKENSRIPDFVQKLVKDYPDEAKRIISLLASWKAAVDKYISIPGFADEVLNATEYISREDLDRFTSGIADEATPLLAEQPDRVVFLYYVDRQKSGREFFYQILRKIPQEMRDKAVLLNSGRLEKEVSRGDRPIPTHIFYCDDSSNSGQQLRDTLSPVSFLLWCQEASAGVTFHIRLLRISDTATKEIETTRQEYGMDINWDIKAKRMPELEDVISRHAHKLSTSRPELISYKPIFGPPTLGIFYHKLQDNLPGIYLKTDSPEVATKAGIEPLFQNSCIVR